MAYLLNDEMKKKAINDRALLYRFNSESIFSVQIELLEGKVFKSKTGQPVERLFVLSFSLRIEVALNLSLLEKYRVEFMMLIQIQTCFWTLW